MTAASAVAEGMDDSFDRLAPGVGSAGSLEGMRLNRVESKDAEGRYAIFPEVLILVIAPD